jgi:AcrR family transcriptional regulator
MTQAERDTGWRGSKELWLNAAYEMLLESGVDAVKILALAEQLNLSRTSFYWFFKDHQQLLNELIARWRDTNTGNLVMQARAYAETLTEAVLNLSDLWFDSSLFDSRFEFAVRSWALQSPAVLAEVQEADLIRLGAIKDLFSRFGQDDMSADVRARTIYLVQIGYISMQTHEDLTLRMTRIPQYVEIFTGRRPQQRELNRFFTKHGYSKSE